MRKVLITAYDINPLKGSESATGWNWVIQASLNNSLAVVTRRNNRDNIISYAEKNNISINNIEFYFYDVPKVFSFWKKGARGSSLYFYLWQVFVPFFVLRSRIEFDVAHNLNFHTDSIPTFLWITGRPTIWGPISHHEKIPRQFIIGLKEYLRDRLRWLAKLWFWRFDVFMNAAKRKSSLIIAGNSSVISRLSLEPSKSTILSQVGSEPPSYLKSNKTNRFTVLIVGRLVNLKGIDVGIEAFHKFYNDLDSKESCQVTLIILGDGPLKDYLNEMIKKLGLDKLVEIKGWVEKKQAMQYFAMSDVFLFPSFEGAGMVVPEALSYGLPIICWDNYGPGELVNSKCAIKIPYKTNRLEAITCFASALTTIYTNSNKRDALGKAAFELFQSNYSWDSIGASINSIYDKV